VKDELQDILGNMMREDVSTIEMLRSNAKAFGGGMIGAEYGYWEEKKEEEENEYFFDKPTLNL